MNKNFYRKNQFKVFHHMCMALGPIGKNNRGQTEWLFECFHNGPGCKGEFVSNLQDVKNGAKKSCGCLYINDISGKIFYDSDGTPTCQALWCVNWDQKGPKKWLFRCLVNGTNCKGTFITTAANVNRKKKPTRSCGCKSGVTNTKHGMSRTSEYRTYINLKQRCENTNNPGYKNYGERGIKNYYKTFEDFYAALGPKQSPNLTLERSDNDLSYTEKNNKWTSRKRQAWNRRSNVIDYEIAEFIRDLYFNRNIPIKNIAEFLKCSNSTVDFVINERTWTN